MFDPTNYTSDGTILEVTFGKGPDTSKYMNYFKKDMLFNTYRVKVIDNRIYKPQNPGGYPSSILATRIVNSNIEDNSNFIEVIYPRDHIVEVTI